MAWLIYQSDTLFIYLCVWMLFSLFSLQDIESRSALAAQVKVIRQAGTGGGSCVSLNAIQFTLVQLVNYNDCFVLILRSCSFCHCLVLLTTHVVAAQMHVCSLSLGRMFINLVDFWICVVAVEPEMYRKCFSFFRAISVSILDCMHRTQCTLELVDQA